MGYAFVYLAAIVAANLSIAYFGPAAAPLNAFLLIGLDLTLRDRLHDYWQKQRDEWWSAGPHELRSAPMPVKMALLIATGGAISYVLNSDAAQIAWASSIAFAAAACIDAVVYHLMRRHAWMRRANGSNVAGAAVDSILFPTIAFGAFMPGVVLAQFVAKVAGGFLWSLGLKRVLAIAAILVGLAMPTAAQPILISAHYDVARQSPIVSAVYGQTAGAVFVNGFVEAWRNPASGYPGGEWSVLSKHWVSRRISRRVSISLEVEALYNRAGVNFVWPEPIDFRMEHRKLHVTPKVGVTFVVR